MEKAINLLKWEPGAPEDLLQVHDYSGVPLLGHPPEVKQGVTAVSKVFGEHYPELKGKTIFVNFPRAFTGMFKAFSVLIPERTRKKFCVLADNDQYALFEHVPAEFVPEALGGLLRTPPAEIVTP